MSDEILRAETPIPPLASGGMPLIRNVLWNLTGLMLPMALALYAMPPLIRGLGTERYGALTLIWMVIGYFSLFDLGLGRALTREVADKLGRGHVGEIPSLFWTSLGLILVLGVVGGLAVAIVSPWLVEEVLKIPAELRSETLKAFFLLSVSFPFLISTAGLGGILAAFQRFDLINLIRIPMNAFMFVGPLLVLPFSKSLYPIAGVLALGRAIFWLVHLLICLRVIPALRTKISFAPSKMVPLLRFGGWVTASNVVGPLTVMADRFLICVLLSVSAVAYYATPYELVARLALIPGALVSVLFPAFASSLVQDRDHAVRLYRRGLTYIFFMMAPLILMIEALARPGLNLWLGNEFAEHSASVLQWLAMGVLINSMAQMPFALLQGAGRPDLTAKLHLIELPLGLLTTWWLIGRYGIDGAAMAWVARVVMDTVILFCMARRIGSGTGRAVH